MGVEGCTKCIKYLLFVFNFVFWLAGGVILGVALWLRHDSQTTSILHLNLDDKPAPSTFYVGIYILIAVGAVMMFVGFLGCYGAIQESQCLLGTVRGQPPPTEERPPPCMDPAQPPRRPRTRFPSLGVPRTRFPSLGVPRTMGPRTVRGPHPQAQSRAPGARSGPGWREQAGRCGRRLRKTPRGGTAGPGKAWGAPGPRQILFFTCLVILFACEVAAGIWGFVNRDKIAKDVKQFYDQALQKAVMESNSGNAKTVVKSFHETLGCCGSDSFTSLITAASNSDLCPSGSNVFTVPFKANCHQKIDELFSGKLYLIGIAAIVVAVIMIFEMILSMVLCCGIRNSSVY
uniref:CD81 molecule n=1 Tax=Sarcophilus harrisii TaxID=9305 RepID=A0A7N4V2F1_SARHA